MHKQFLLLPSVSRVKGHHLTQSTGKYQTFTRQCNNHRMQIDLDWFVCTNEINQTVLYAALALADHICHRKLGFNLKTT